MENHIILNRIRTPDGTILTSYKVHDYVSHKDAVTGGTYAVDGGTDYLRRTFTHRDYEDMSVHMSDPHEVRREAFSWGTLGKNGKGPLEYIKLKDLENEHLAILEEYTTGWVATLMQDEITYRELSS